MNLVERRKKERFLAELQRFRHAGVMYVWRAYRLNWADAEDVVSDVIVRLYNKYSTDELHNIRALFFTSCNNRAVDLHRARKARPRVVDLEAAADCPTEDDFFRTEAIDTISAIIEEWNVKPTTKRVLLLRLAGYTIPECAKTVGVSLPAAKKAVFRGMQFLRTHRESLIIEDAV